MKWLILLCAIALAPAAWAQAGTPSQPDAGRQNAGSPPASSPSAPTAGNTSAPRGDNAVGAAANTGTAHPNTTGSSGTSGTNGVDSSTGNSH
jgi:hypothetical protein